MKHTYAPMTWKERDEARGESTSTLGSVDEKKTLPNVRIEMPPKIMKGLKLGDKISITITGNLTKLAESGYEQGIELDMLSVEIPKSALAAEVKKVL